MANVTPAEGAYTNFGSPVIADDRVYIIDRYAGLRVLNATTGTQIGMGGPINIGAPVIMEGAAFYSINAGGGHAVVRADIGEVVESTKPKVTITSPNSSDRFARGEIIPIEIKFENTTRGTLTFGDREAHNVEINVTVRDADGDGKATIYLNTFQVGHGYLRNGSGALEPNGFDPATEASRNHGFFTLKGDGTTLVGEEGKTAIAHSGMDITGGSQGGAVLGTYAYDLSSVAGEQPFTEAELLDDRHPAVVRKKDEVSIELWTAPGAGVNTIKPETIDDIDTAMDEGRITPADGVIANQDFLIVELQSQGLTGVFHEAILQEDGVSVDDLLDREDDNITKIWNLPTDDLVWTAEARETDVDVPEGERVTISLSQNRVIGGTREAVINFERFYLVVRLEEGTNVTESTRELEPGTNLTAGLCHRFGRRDWERYPGWVQWGSHRRLPVRSGVRERGYGVGSLQRDN